MFRDLLEERSKLIAKFYHEVYDWHLWFEAFSDSLPSHSIILDFGCGEGKNLTMFVDRHRNWHGVGVDISKESLHIAASNAETQNVRPLTDFILADANHLPFRSNVFWGAVVIDVFHHLPDLFSVNELHRVIKTKGKLLVIDQPMTHPFKFLARRATQFLGTHSYTYGRPFLFFSANTLEYTLKETDFVVLKKEYKEFWFIFLYLLMLLPNFLFQASLKSLSKNVLKALSVIEGSIGKFPLINIFCAYVFFLCINKNDNKAYSKRESANRILILEH